MGMVKVFNLMTAMLDDHRYLVHSYAFQLPEGRTGLSACRWEGVMTRHHRAAVHHRQIYAVLELEAIPLTLDRESMIIMLGGWKQYTPGARSAATSSTRRRNDSSDRGAPRIRDTG